MAPVFHARPTQPIKNKEGHLYAIFAPCGNDNVYARFNDVRYCYMFE